MVSHQDNGFFGEKALARDRMKVDRIGFLRALGEKERQMIGECTVRKKWGYERDFILVSFVLE